MGLPMLPEEEIYPVFRRDLLDSEKETIEKFRIYFIKTWINQYSNLSVFYCENATNNGVESYYKTLKS